MIGHSLGRMESRIKEFTVYTTLCLQAGLSATCSTKISTFTTSLEWPAVADTMNLKSEAIAASRSNTDACYHIDTSYTVEGPEGYGFHKDKLFVNPAGNASDISYRVELLPRVRQLVFVDQESGDIVISPLQEHTNTTFTAVLYGKDVGSAEAEVKRWRFAVRARPTFRVAAYTRVATPLPTQGAAVVAPVINVTARSKTPFVVGEAFRFAPVTLTSVDHAEIAACTFTIRGDTEGIFVNPKTGEVQGLAVAEGQARFILEAIDAHGARDVVEAATLTFQYRDTSNPANGPSNRTCSHNGRAVDGVAFDRAFTCNCGGTAFTGPNCEDAVADGADDDAVAMVAVGILAPATLLLLLLAIVTRYNAYRKTHTAADFTEELRLLSCSSEIERGIHVPREMPRAWLTLIERIGTGNFGEVWKGLLKDKEHSAVPEYMVAAKTVLATDRSAEAAGAQDLLQEAAVMAHVGDHQNLVALVGVITKGAPWTIVVSFCEHGDLVGVLKTHAADGTPFPEDTKLRMCCESASGMSYLVLRRIVHRDLAARNVLVASGMVCKVADFGLSRHVSSSASSEYYRVTGSSFAFPVKWTAPEAIQDAVFSEASDAWAFAVTAVEIWQDGLQPYTQPHSLSNPAARGSHLDLDRAPYVLYGVKYIDLVSLAPFSGHCPGYRARRPPSAPTKLPR